MHRNITLHYFINVVLFIFIMFDLKCLQPKINVLKQPSNIPHRNIWNIYNGERVVYLDTTDASTNIYEILHSDVYKPLLFSYSAKIVDKARCSEF